MAEVFILVGIGAEGGDEGRGGGGVLELAEGLGGEEFHAAIGILKGRDEGVGLIGGTVVAEDLDRLGTDLRIGVAQEAA